MNQAPATGNGKIHGQSFFTVPAKEKEEYFNSLSMSEQASIVLMTPWEKRLEIMLLARDAKSLVQSLPVEELFWSIKSSGPEESLEILQLASPEQFQFFFDLDWWKKADLVREKIIAWLFLLMKSGHHAVNAWFEWINLHDHTLIPSILRLFVKVYKRPDDMDIEEAKDLFPPFSLDNDYFIGFKNPKLSPLLSMFIEKMLTASPGLYRNVMETMIWETRSDNLENSYKLRHSRLSDWGIPDYHEAIEIYAPVHKGKIRKIFKSHKHTGETETLMPAFIPTLYLGDYPYLGKAVEALTGSREMERIIFEWIAVSNKIIIADSVNLDDAAAIRNALLKTSALLNLGLEIACMEEMKKPADIFSASPLEDLVRLANSSIRGLSSHVRRLIKKNIIPNDLSFIQAPWLEILQGLLFERPLLWDPVSASYRAPVSLAEVNSTKEICRLVENTGLIMSSLSPHWSKWETAFLWRDTNLKSSKGLTWDIALITALSQKALENKLVICPVSKNQLHDLYKIWFDKERGEPFKHIIPWAETVLAPITTKVNVSSNVISRLIIRPVLDLREEMVSVFEKSALDAKYISKLFVET